MLHVRTKINGELIGNGLDGLNPDWNKRIFPSKTSKLDLGTTQPPIQ